VLGSAERADVVIEACIGPRSDAYNPTLLMDADEAERYHAVQLRALADTGCTQVSALTLTYPEEAIGIARAATAVGLPVVVGFTVETDGRLPNGTSIEDAILAVDSATDGAPLSFMINCAHPTHFADALPAGEARKRIGGLRANASTLSHAELDEAEELDSGDPDDRRALRRPSPRSARTRGRRRLLRTDIRHVTAICDAGCRRHRALALLDRPGQAHQVGPWPVRVARRVRVLRSGRTMLGATSLTG
jgi:homocysteine S-methyltransferase